MRDLKKIALAVCIALSTLVAVSCSKDDETVVEPQLTPSEILASTPWETTNAKNNKGESVVLTDANVSNFVGFAYFKSDGTFTMFNLDNSPKMHGERTVSADGKTRTIVAKNASGETLFTRVVDITVLTKKEFTYRVYPSANDKTIYFDIIHTPTTHQEPK